MMLRSGVSFGFDGMVKSSQKEGSSVHSEALLLKNPQNEPETPPSGPSYSAGPLSDSPSPSMLFTPIKSSQSKPPCLLVRGLEGHSRLATNVNKYIMLDQGNPTLTSLKAHR